MKREANEMTPRVYHEIRDPIHTFIKIDTDERIVIDSRPVQRLRNIHQLALEYLIYPGATHKRFEHALGVMELASRVFDIITRPDLVHNSIRESITEISESHQLVYWRRVLRMAALCHDIGHLPFSHAAEEEMLPEELKHEDMTVRLIRSEEMSEIWASVTPPLRTEDIVKLAVGPEKLPDIKFTNWEAILSEIVVGDAFGIDRMDYLLRDSLHAGVQYGKFDHHRLIDSLRILPSNGENGEPTLGLELGGIFSAEALLLARYSMFSQLYLHRVRRAYDVHLKDFLREWLLEGKFLTDVESFLLLSDIEVLAAIRQLARDNDQSELCVFARRIAERGHFKVAYERNPEDLELDPEPGTRLAAALVQEFGQEAVRHDLYVPRGAAFDFPVLMADNRILSSLLVSDILPHLPVAAIDFVFVDPSVRDKARQWVGENRERILGGG